MRKFLKKLLKVSSICSNKTLSSFLMKKIWKKKKISSKKNKNKSKLRKLKVKIWIKKFQMLWDNWSMPKMKLISNSYSIWIWRWSYKNLKMNYKKKRWYFQKLKIPIINAKTHLIYNKKKKTKCLKWSKTVKSKLRTFRKFLKKNKISYRI